MHFCHVKGRMDGGEYLNWIDTLSQAAREALLSRRQILHFNAGASIHERMTPPKGVLRIEKGRVRVFLLRDTGSELLLKICEKGETIGDVAAIDGSPYPSFAEAMTDVVGSFISMKDLNEVRKTFPEIERALLMQLASTARGVVALLERVTMHSMDKQVVSRVLWLARSQRLQGQRSNTINVSQGDLALMLGASRQTVNKALSRLESDGLIKREYGAISIADKEGMQALLTPDYNR